MGDIRLASIIVNNYNYGRYLEEAIDSALNQTYPNTEVIVVDDGSTDNSRAIIAAYGDRILPVLKENGGQASAFNAGFRVSRGEVVVFLDSDDALVPAAVENAAKLLLDPDVAKVHWPLWAVDEHGSKTGGIIPGYVLPDGDFRETVLRDGPGSCPAPPTTGNAWARRFLETVFPMPEEQYRICADAYLFALAPAFGAIRRISEPQGVYRVHSQNNYWGKAFDESLDRGVSVFDQQCLGLSEFFRRRGIGTDPAPWKNKSWFHRLQSATQDIAALVPPAGTFILVDEDQWGTGEVVAGRRRSPFVERDGQYAGPPPDDASAVRELERLRLRGADFMIFAWPAFWWLEYYTGLHQYLRSQFRCVVENERLVAFDLRL